MELGEKLKSLRTSAGLTQARLAEAVEVAPRTISKWENGLEEPTLSDIRKLCKALGCKKSDLVEETEEKPVRKVKTVEAKPVVIEKKVGKLEKNKQSYLKGLATAGAVISKIVRILTYIGIGCLAFCVVFVPIILGSFDIIGGNTIKINGVEETIVLEPTDETKYTIRIDDKEETIDLNFSNKLVSDFLNDYSKTKAICLIEVSLIITIAGMLITSFILKNTEKLFNNVQDGHVFTEDNAVILRNVGYLIIASFVIPFLAGIVPNSVMGTNFGEDFSLVDVISILAIFALSYIFEYGSAIQEDSKSVIYDED